MKHTIEAAELITLARQVFEIESNAVLALTDRLGSDFVDAVRLILNCHGRVVVSGMGKSGHIARKIAATMASTGTPAFFVHPAEASHGDLGMITPHDIVIALSNSGESAELLAILPLLKRQGAGLISITGSANSTLAIQSDIHLDAGVEKEACPLGLAPTSSTTAALAMGDALAVALLHARGFGPDDFARSHPGGSLGKRLLVRVSDIMHTDDELPIVHLSSRLSDALLEMSAKGLGMTAIVDDERTVIGIYTDGDLRRTLATNVDLRTASIAEVMKRNPRTIAADRLAAEAVKQMDSLRINGLLVIDAQGKLVGAMNMHDLFRAGVL